MDDRYSDILVVGAGMAGLTCAGALAKAGLKVRVLDKGRGPGGRMAARRAQIAGPTVSFDHGAQFFTARDPAFQSVVGKWETLGAVSRWPAAGKEAWVGTPGMNGPIKVLAEDLDVRWSTRVLRLAKENDGWCIETEEERFKAPIALVAVPAEQAAELLEEAAPELSRVAVSVRSEPCWAAMGAFAQRLNVSEDCLRSPDAQIAWAARNSAKPDRTGEECWVLHASPKRSREIIDVPKDEAAVLLLADFFAQTGIQPQEALHLTAHRWLYAMPKSLKGEPARFDVEAGVGIAGDYLHSPRVEGAFLSGLALAERVLSTRP